MAVFRVEKNQNYTVMSNHHLRNADLSLKSKGLLSQMLSLPEEWDYTLKGLSQINREGIDAIREAVRELERAGYVTRTRVRNEKGQLGAADYVIHEFPVPPKPILENPTLDKPVSENPTLENPMQENPTQLNKELSSKELSNTDLLNTHSIPILSTSLPEGTAAPERKGNGCTNMDAVRAYEEVIKDNIEYACLIQDKNIDRGMLDEIVALMLETVCTRRKVVRIAGDDYPAELVKRACHRRFGQRQDTCYRIGRRTGRMGRYQSLRGLRKRQSGRKITGHETAYGRRRRCADRHDLNPAAFRLISCL